MGIRTIVRGIMHARMAAVPAAEAKAIARQIAAPMVGKRPMEILPRRVRRELLRRSRAGIAFAPQGATPKVDVSVELRRGA